MTLKVSFEHHSLFYWLTSYNVKEYPQYPSLIFLNPPNFTISYFTTTLECTDSITSLLIFPSTVTLPHILSNTPFFPIKYSTSFQSIPLSQQRFTLQFQMVSGLCQMSALVTYQHPPRRALSQRFAVADNLPWSCPFPQANTLTIFLRLRLVQNRQAQTTWMRNISLVNKKSLKLCFKEQKNTHRFE